MVKRGFDFVLSFAGLVGLSPMFLAIGLALKLTSPGPILYRGTRVGRNGEPFQIYKFRTMVVGADKLGPGITTAGDSRVTPVGKFLRRFKLDEFPQLLNVLKGEMSLVGPRPEDPRYVALYTLEQREILNHRPGITSPASVKYRNESAALTDADWERKYVQEIMPEKLAIDAEYFRRAGLGDDLRTIARTFRG